jgi:hypothetical protein
MVIDQGLVQNAQQFILSDPGPDCRLKISQHCITRCTI